MHHSVSVILNVMVVAVRASTPSRHPHSHTRVIFSVKGRRIIIIFKSIYDNNRTSPTRHTNRLTERESTRWLVIPNQHHIVGSVNRSFSNRQYVYPDTDSRQLNNNNNQTDGRSVIVPVNKTTTTIGGGGKGANSMQVKW